jgi:hypothetical protein
VDGAFGVERLNIPEEGAPGEGVEGLMVRGAEKDRLPREPPDIPPPARARASLETQSRMKALSKVRVNTLVILFL